MLTAPHSEIGRRIFFIQKLHAVERALRAIRTRLGPEWKDLPIADRALLNHTLGEVWIASRGETWDAIPFARMSAEDLGQVVEVARMVQSGAISEQEGTQRILRVLTGTF